MSNNNNLTTLHLKLTELLERLKNLYEEKRILFQNNEEQVKLSLVFPILQALGWDIFNPDEVAVEVKTSSGDEKIDIVLYRIYPPQITVVIEVKNSSENLYKNTWEKQVMQYATLIGATYAILTNGIKWRIFKAYEINKPISNRHLFDIDISENEVEKFLTLSKEYIHKLDFYAKFFMIEFEDDNKSIVFKEKKLSTSI